MICSGGVSAMVGAGAVSKALTPVGAALYSVRTQIHAPSLAMDLAMDKRDRLITVRPWRRAEGGSLEGREESRAEHMPCYVGGWDEVATCWTKFFFFRGAYDGQRVSGQGTVDCGWVRWAGSNVVVRC